MNQLKEAEKKATQLVQDARKARTDRLKEAKAESEQIINQFRDELDKKYKAEFEKQSKSGGLSNNELTATTNTDIARLNQDFNNRKASVEQMLIDAVLSVKVQAPQARGA